MKRISLGTCLWILMATFATCHIFALPALIKTDVGPDSTQFPDYLLSLSSYKWQNASDNATYPKISEESDAVLLQRVHIIKYAAFKIPGVAASVTLLPDTITPCVGDTISVPISVTGDNVDGLDLYLDFDHTVLLNAPPDTANTFNLGFDAYYTYNYLNLNTTAYIYIIKKDELTPYNFTGEMIIVLKFVYNGGTTTIHLRTTPDSTPPPLCKMFDFEGHPITSVAYTDNHILPSPGSVGTPVFTAGATTLCQDAADETYTATAINATGIAYSVLPVSAGTIGTSNGVMNWDAAFTGTATIKAIASGCNGPKTADRVVTVIPTVGDPSFMEGATARCQGATTGTYTVTATNTTGITYSVLPGTAGTININTGVMAWNAAFIGTATITASAAGCNGSKTVSRVVTVYSSTICLPPDITCKGPIDQTTDPDLCTAALDPGFPTPVSGIPPIDYTWVMTVATTGSGNGPIGPHTFNLGLTIITWIATNIAGSDQCTQTITVADYQQPSFTVPPPQSFCVEDIHTANYYDPTMDITPVRPDYYQFRNGFTALDITGITDNCCAQQNIVIKWHIVFSATPDPLPPHNLITKLPIYGQGQPSMHSDMTFPGDGVTFLDVTHHITYYIVDCNGNTSAEQTIGIIIKPRPNVTKQ